VLVLVLVLVLVSCACVLSGVDQKSKAARVDEKNNDDRTPHGHSKLHDAVESCHHYLSRPHEPPYSSHRYRMFGTLADGTVVDGQWSAKGLLEFRLLHNILSLLRLFLNYNLHK
jgi:hypothetical protein